MRDMQTKFRLAIYIALLLIAQGKITANAEAAQTEGAQQFAELGDFQLQTGGVIQDFRLGYRTLGHLNTQKSNAILWPSWLGGKSQDLLQFLGPGNVVDTSKYFAVLVDAIGNGISSSPSNSKKQPLMTFPRFSIRDMVEAEHRLAVEVLHLSHFHAVMGISMGGMQTFEWIAAYPEFMDLAIPCLARRNRHRSTSCFGPRRWTPFSLIPRGITEILPDRSA
jgi:homoserine O-acetyltransferase